MCKVFPIVPLLLCTVFVVAGCGKKSSGSSARKSYVESDHKAMLANLKGQWQLAEGKLQEILMARVYVNGETIPEAELKKWKAIAEPDLKKGRDGVAALEAANIQEFQDREGRLRAIINNSNQHIDQAMSIGILRRPVQPTGPQGQPGASGPPGPGPGQGPGGAPSGQQPFQPPPRPQPLPPSPH